MLAVFTNNNTLLTIIIIPKMMHAFYISFIYVLKGDMQGSKLRLEVIYLDV